MAVFACAFAELTLMKRPVMALRPMPAGFFLADARFAMTRGLFTEAKP
jgi:hypothetical protein